MTYDHLSREQLEEALAALEEELAEREDEHERLRQRAKKIKADFQNYRDSQDERRERWKDEARQELATDLIEVIDNLERAIMSADEDSTILKGVEMVHDQLYSVLEQRGLSRIEAEGEEFDPRRHTAVDVEEHHTHNEVLERRRHGYRYGDRVLREAEVVVGQHPDHMESQDSDGTAEGADTADDDTRQGDTA